VRGLSHRAKELDLRLPLLESVLPNDAVRVDRSVDAILRTKKRKIAFPGFGFKAGTDDLRESPQVHVLKRLLGEGCQAWIWDRDVSWGRLAVSNRRYIEKFIPHIGSLLSGEFEELARSGEVVGIAIDVEKQRGAECVKLDRAVIDLIHLSLANCRQVGARRIRASAGERKTAYISKQ
jgi:GDP-mannose 6-dehydrogenase